MLLMSTRLKLTLMRALGFSMHVVKPVGVAGREVVSGSHLVRLPPQG